MRIVLTGSAGFIGTAVGSALEDAGHEVVRVDVMLPQAHGATEPPPGTHRVDVRDAAAWPALLDGVDAVCHQAAVVGAGVTVADLPAYAGVNDLGTAVLLAAMHVAGVDRLVLASSMVVYGEGRYTCPEHGDRVPRPRSRAALEAGDVENHCPVCGAVLGWALVDEDARLDPRSSYAASKVAQEHYTSRGGISAEEMDRVFDLAWRGEAARTPRPEGAEGQGAGLGLAIVKGIVEAHRGVVEVENVDGDLPAGCRFRVLLPT